jgi:hypothetical protein
MRRSVALSSLTALAVPGLLAATMATAAASSSAPAPECMSYSSQLFCDASSPVSPVTWTMTLTQAGITTKSTFSGPAFLRGNCLVGAGYGFSYSYVNGGVTFISPATRFVCTSNRPE